MKWSTIVFGPLMGPVVEKVVSDVLPDQPIAQLQEQAIRQELEQRIWEAKARTLQEFAIATRIDTADTVEIEEFYDLTGQGSIGVNLKEEGATAGISAAGRKGTKRIYRFSGWREGSQPKDWEAFQQQFDDVKKRADIE
jgi:hypothetical protein